MIIGLDYIKELMLSYLEATNIKDEESLHLMLIAPLDVEIAEELKEFKKDYPGDLVTDFYTLNIEGIRATIDIAKTRNSGESIRVTSGHLDEPHKHYRYTTLVPESNEKGLIAPSIISNKRVHIDGDFKPCSTYFQQEPICDK